MNTRRSCASGESGHSGLRKRSRAIPSLVTRIAAIDLTLPVAYERRPLSSECVLFRGSWVIAETSDGKLIYGLLVRHSTGDEPREVYLVRPALITFDDDRHPIKTPLGEAILITDDNLGALRFLSSPTDLQIDFAGDPKKR